MDLQNLPGTAAKKLCKACGISKSIFEFSAHPQTKDRLRPKCKSCRRLVYYSSKTKCAVPGCSVKTDKRANCCIPHANIKKAYPDVPDNALDQIDIKSKSNEYFALKAKEYRDAGKTKKRAKKGHI